MSPTPRTLGKSSAFLYRESPTPLAFFEVPDRFANANQLSVGRDAPYFITIVERIFGRARLSEQFHRYRVESRATIAAYF